MSFDLSTLITDRTSADVAAGNNKGTYNARDLNRVGQAMVYVSDQLKACGYDPHIKPKTNWTETDYPTASTMLQYLSDLSELRKQFAMLSTTPIVPADMANLTHEEANDIERILLHINDSITRLWSSLFYSAEIYSGEG